MQKKAAFKPAFNFLYGNVRLKKIWLDETREEMELSLLYADRYNQTARYDGVYYYDFTPEDEGLYISMAEELPVTELLAPRFQKALHRFLGPRARLEAGFLEELAARGSKLYVNYGKTDDYIVIARSASVKG